MQRILISLFALFIRFGFAVQEAEAKRMGGSKSFGMQRSAPAKQDAAPTPQRTASPAECWSWVWHWTRSTPASAATTRRTPDRASTAQGC